MRLLLAIMLLLPSLTFANPYDWKVTRVIDGDTVEVKVSFLPIELGDKLSIRIGGVDTPEKGFRAKCVSEKLLGEQATTFTKNFVKSAKSVRINITEWDKYGGRVIGDIIVDGKSLKNELITRGYAVPYNGGTKGSWCK